VPHEFLSLSEVFPVVTLAAYPAAIVQILARFEVFIEKMVVKFRGRTMAFPTRHRHAIFRVRFPFAGESWVFNMVTSQVGICGPYFHGGDIVV
jgi:hypothetical protein